MPELKDQISVAHTTRHQLVCKSTPTNAHLSSSSMEHTSSYQRKKALKKKTEKLLQKHIVLVKKDQNQVQM